MFANLHISVIIPALNEAAAITLVVQDLLAVKDAQGIAVIDDLIVADNGSSDGTAELASHAGARVVNAPHRGYGSACLAAIASITATDIVVFVDGDHSVVAAQVIPLLDAIVNGADLVIGSRVQGHIEAGAITWAQHFGNGLVAKLISRLWHTEVTDLGPFRAIRYGVLKQLAMRDLAYGWTVEMQVKALQHGFCVQEIPVACRVRLGYSKVSGTVRGVIGAGFGMLTTVLYLWWQGRAVKTHALSNICLCSLSNKAMQACFNAVKSTGKS